MANLFLGMMEIGGRHYKLWNMELGLKQGKQRAEGRCCYCCCCDAIKMVLLLLLLSSRRFDEIVRCGDSQRLNFFYRRAEPAEQCPIFASRE